VRNPHTGGKKVQEQGKKPGAKSSNEGGTRREGCKHTRANFHLIGRTELTEKTTEKEGKPGFQKCGQFIATQNPHNATVNQAREGVKRRAGNRRTW